MSSELQDYYQLLQVDPLATPAEIKASWRKLAKEHHPDRNQGDEFAGKRFSLLNEAYQVLSDENKRRSYDRDYRRVFGTPRARRQQAAGSTGRAGGAASSASRRDSGSSGPAPVRGRNVERSVSIPLKRMRGGGSFRVPLEHLRRELVIQLPDPVLPGSQMVFPGQGHPGRNGGAAGSLSLELKVDLPEGCFAEGADLHCVLPVHALRAAAGGKVRVTHPDGRSFAANLPAGTADGWTLRLKGKGLPARPGDGDLVCHIQVAIPPIPEGRARRLAEKLISMLGLE